MKERKYCSKCGHELIEDAKFCVVCQTPNPLYKKVKIISEGSAIDKRPSIFKYVLSYAFCMTIMLLFIIYVSPYLAVLFHCKLETFLYVLLGGIYMAIVIHLSYEIFHNPFDKFTDLDGKMGISILSFVPVVNIFIAILCSKSSKRYWHWITFSLILSWISGYAYYAHHDKIEYFNNGYLYTGFETIDILNAPPNVLKIYLEGRDPAYEEWSASKAKKINEEYLENKEKLRLLMDEFRQYQEPYYEYKTYDSMKARQQFKEKYAKCGACLELCAKYLENNDVVEAEKSLNRAKEIYSGIIYNLNSIKYSVIRTDYGERYSNEASENAHGYSGPAERALVPMQEWIPCNICHNSGTCQVCYGNGYTGSGNTSSECISCNGSTKCSYCAGQGGHYEVVYR